MIEKLSDYYIIGEEISKADTLVAIDDSREEEIFDNPHIFTEFNPLKLEEIKIEELPEDHPSPDCLKEFSATYDLNIDFRYFQFLKSLDLLNVDLIPSVTNKGNKRVLISVCNLIECLQEDSEKDLIDLSKLSKLPIKEKMLFFTSEESQILFAHKDFINKIKEFGVPNGMKFCTADKWDLDFEML